MHLQEISRAKVGDSHIYPKFNSKYAAKLAFVQLLQTPRMQEVLMMLIASLEKLF